MKTTTCFYDLGVSPATAALLISATAPARHAERVEATLAAARAAAASDDVAPALMALAIDHAGAGGRRGLEGLGTSRWLVSLGKGRWQAGDGPAYESAARDAMARLVGADARLSPEVYQAVAALPGCPQDMAVTLGVVIVTSLLGQPAGHCRLSWAPSTHEPSWDTQVHELVAGPPDFAARIPVDGGPEEWAEVLDEVVQRRDARARAVWRREVVQAARAAVGGRPLTKDDLARSVRAGWGSYPVPMSDMPLRSVLAQHERPGEWGLEGWAA